MIRVTPAQLAAYRDRVQPHFLYRCYDDEGLLIYIGCSVNVKKRMVTHRSSRASRASRLLARFMDRYEVDADSHPGRLAGRAAEAEAIAAERPVFNMQERRTPTSLACDGIGRYLVRRGHVGLARELACTCWRETRDAGCRDTWCAAHQDEDRPLFDEAASA